MALSLDYLGKLVIVLIVVAVSVGMIMEFRGQIEGTTPDPGNDDDPGLEIVEVAGSSSTTKVADLITLCHQRSLEKGYEDLSCFVARKKSGNFNLDASTLEEQLEPDVNQSTEFEASTYDRSSIIIQYSVASQKVVVKE